MRFKNIVTAIPAELESRDSIALKVVAVAGCAHDWAAYRGPANWADERVAEYGIKIPREAAEGLFYAFAKSGRVYRE